MRLGEVRVGGEVVDSALGWFLPGPGSYTGEDTVEVCCHGSPVVLSAVVDAAVGLGARVAAGGEFTLRAFLNGRMDLAQAESVVSVVRAGSLAEAAAAVGGLNGGVKALAVRLQGGLVEVGARLEAALDFADEEGVSGALEGVGGAMVGLEEEAARALAGEQGAGGLGGRMVVALVGGVNVGKSTLFNRLLGQELAIVDAGPGTTRDMVRGEWWVDGRRVELVDTAGLRETGDRVEREGVRRSLATAARAGVVVVVVDGTRGWGEAEDQAWGVTGGRGLVVVNKADVCSGEGDVPEGLGAVPLRVSGLTGQGVPALREAIAERVGNGGGQAGLVVTGERQRQEMRAVLGCVRRARQVIERGEWVEMAAVELREARRHLDRLVGRDVEEDVLERVFREFCVGK